MIKYSNKKKSNLGEKELIWAYDSRFYSFIEGKSRWQVLEIASHIVSQSRQRENGHGHTQFLVFSSVAPL